MIPNSDAQHGSDGSSDITDVHPSNVLAMPTPVTAQTATPPSERVEMKVPPPVSVNLDKEVMKSFIAAGDEFVGDVHCKGGVRICGTVKGSVHCTNGPVYVEHGGAVTGSIESQADVYIDGAVGVASEGDAPPSQQIKTPGKVTLMNRCVVNANVLYGKLASEDDMELNGSTRKLGKSTT